ncbi:biopolymer transporter ExbD [Bartonella krasnovii]|uniref:Biopolymer transporter ExbD n=1 Tax=Bartonella krasnovii TaxID=2267275 RepID=A0A5B9D416_9HYPH|nr:biopolymer transporter ExbD [Bartonella krasnovii]QEE12764.1 biopolymer transporter ExbD [Bartonella krasnovii]UNF28880.1 biopolymer transporter ExbD [Bartonella krasnovii]UNF35246.1 biopolymer transporter ExbD [Bartonella krasnovii]UNF36874.1 biopolymer transporter ExbD [Bartonella krasnovii]UNF38560.1 biopolymer transporter ExbD [Bartonella krasnovii]
MKASFNDDFDLDENGLHSEINVTPFIDVVLVLLIVFMVAAPLATSVIPVQLPSITQAPLEIQPDEPLYVTLQKDHSLYIGNHLIEQAALRETLLRETKQNLETKILIKADSEIDYGIVIDLLNQIRMAGYGKIGLVGLQNASNFAARGGQNHKTADGTKEPVVTEGGVGVNVVDHGQVETINDTVNAHISGTASAP